MNNKLVCPFCGETMEECKGELYDFYGCHKTSCFEKYGWFSASVLQVLIQAKQDLEIARKTLKELWQATHYDTDGYLGKTIQQALKQTTHDNSEKANSVEHKE